jgi:uncharacterized phage-associated protein
MMIEGTVLPEDRSIENKVVILALLQKAQETGHAALTRIQVHKLLFVSEQEMWHQKILSTGFRFIKMSHGPWSVDIENTVAQLEDLGLVETRQVSTLRGEEAKLAGLTETGSELIKSILELPSSAPEDAMLQAIDNALTEYGALSSAELAEASHNFKNLVTKKTVEDTPLRGYLLTPRPRRQATAVLEVDDSVKETLEIMEDKEFHEDILDSMERARQGVFRPYHPGEEIPDIDEGNRSRKQISQ